jgi:hypothetical protein
MRPSSRAALAIALAAGSLLSAVVAFVKHPAAAAGASPRLDDKKQPLEGCRFSTKAKTMMVSRSVRFGIGVVALCAAVGLMQPPASAASPRIPAADFPHGAVVAYSPSLSNADFDTVWGTTGTETNGFHSVPSDGLGRTGGWAEDVLLLKPRHKQHFAIFVSTYRSEHQAQLAAQDLAQTLVGYGMDSLDAPVRGLHGSTEDTTLQIHSRDARWTIFGFTLVRGTTEVEALVEFRTKHGDAVTDKADLVRAVNDATR